MYYLTCSSLIYIYIIMKIIKVWDKEINLNIGENLTMKEMRKIYPIIKEREREWNEIEMIIWIVKELSSDENIEDTINGMDLQEFTTLSEEISKIIETKKK